MVPSRSRNTAGLRTEGSGRGHLRSAGKQGGFDHRRRNGSHAAVVGGAAPQETWAAGRLLLDDRGARCDRRRTFGIRGTKNGNDRQTNRRGNMHGSGIVAEKEMAL